jgi:hypothetical protein
LAAAVAAFAACDVLAGVLQPIIPAAAVNINPHSEIRRVEACIDSPCVGTGYCFFDETFYASNQNQVHHATL